MRRLPVVLLACLSIPAIPAAGQHAGDILLTVPGVGGPIVTSGGTWTGQYAGRVFDDGVMPTDTPYKTGSPGFDSLAGTFPAGATIRFDFAKQLLYWDGSALASPPAAMTLDYQPDQGGRSATITGSDTAGAPGFTITSVPSDGAFHEHLDYKLPDGAATGLYGLVLTLGPGAGSSGFTTSEPFLITFEQGFPTNVTAGVQAMVDVAFAPVPEPSTVALLGMAAAGGAWLAARRGRKKGLQAHARQTG
jgi:hypothetical protein